MQHIAEDALEQYAMGAFSELEAGPLEEHLLICAACQDRLQTTDEYVAAMCGAVERVVVKKAAAHPAPAIKQASGH